MRDRDGSRDTKELLLHLRPYLWPKRALGTEVDPPSEKVFEEDLHVHVPVEGRLCLELDEQIDVAVGPGLVPRHRSEERELPDAERRELLALTLDPLDDLVARHEP